MHAIFHRALPALLEQCDAAWILSAQAVQHRVLLFVTGVGVVVIVAHVAADVGGRRSNDEVILG